MTSILSPMARVYGTLKMGDNCRVDDFCIITGNVELGDNVHIGCYSFLAGGEGIFFEDYSALAPRVSIFTTSDDYSGLSMTNPTVPEKYRPYMDKAPVWIRKHGLIGAHSVILPGVVVGVGTSVGACSLITKSLGSWGIYAGVPAKRIKERSRFLLALQEVYERDQSYLYLVKDQEDKDYGLHEQENARARRGTGIA